MVKKITPRGKTKKFVLNEKFIFGGIRCLRCPRILKSGEFMICDICKNKRGKL